jgi:hypothetical protein
MSYTEFVSWCRYRNKYGGLHIGMRIDRAFGRVAAFFGNAFSTNKDLQPDDFSPMDKAIKESAEAEQGSIHEVFAMLKHTARSG